MGKLKLLLLVCLVMICAPLFAEVNINTANEEQLAKELTNIGAVKAAAIVRYRQENGPFKTVDELANVRGVGVATIEKNRHRIKLEGTTVDDVENVEHDETPQKILKKRARRMKSHKLEF